MPDIELRFTRDEFAARLEKTRRAMEAKGVDLLIVTDPSNMNWLTGYDGWSFYVHQCVIVPPRASRSGMAAARMPMARS
jgi:ectoine hydrolase